ncbi:hypothetical protein ACFYW1_04605 [Streptomyces sp. NPDC002669]
MLVLLQTVWLALNWTHGQRKATEAGFRTRGPGTGTTKKTAGARKRSAS